MNKKSMTAQLKLSPPIVRVMECEYFEIDNNLPRIVFKRCESEWGFFGKIPCQWNGDFDFTLDGHFCGWELSKKSFSFSETYYLHVKRDDSKISTLMLSTALNNSTLVLVQIETIAWIKFYLVQYAGRKIGKMKWWKALRIGKSSTNSYSVIGRWEMKRSSSKRAKSYIEAKSVTIAQMHLSQKVYFRHRIVWKRGGKLQWVPTAPKTRPKQWNLVNKRHSHPKWNTKNMLPLGAVCCRYRYNSSTEFCVIFLFICSWSVLMPCASVGQHYAVCASSVNTHYAKT